MLGIAELKQFRRGGFDGSDGELAGPVIRTGRPERSMAIASRTAPVDSYVDLANQRHVIGRALPVRHGSSTRCAAR